MMFSSSLLLSLLSLTMLIASTWAFPYGAGSCPEGASAIGGPHLTYSPLIQGTIPKGTFVVYLDGVALTPGVPANFTVGANHVLKLKNSVSGSTFTGLLFRLGGNANTSAALRVPSGASDVRLETDYCIGVAGITQVDSSDKTSSSAVLRMDEKALNLPLDVTVVVFNAGDEGSKSFYSGYILNAVGGKSSSTTGSTSSSGSSSGSSNSSGTSNGTSNSTGSSNSSDYSNSTGSTQPSSSDTTSASTGGSSSPSKGFVISILFLSLLTLISLVTFMTSNGYLRRSKKETEG